MEWACGGGLCSLLGDETANPVSWWARLVRIVKGVHDAVCLVAGLVCVGYVGLFVEDEEEVHEITSNSAPV